MGKFIALLLGSGLTVGIVRATAQHYWAKHLKKRETTDG